MGHATSERELIAADALRQVPVLRGAGHALAPSLDVLAIEAPVALEYNGVSHVVMLASPADLQDFALGFSLSEGVVDDPSELYGCEIETGPQGVTLKMEIASARFATLKERRRNLAGRTGCGLCGAESLERALRKPPPVSHRHPLPAARVLAAMQAMRRSQPLLEASGATHATAWMRADGLLACVREDVGRHNALDKLIGALSAGGEDFSQGAALLTSRASVEMVQKCAAMGIGVVAAISAPTSLAVQWAQDCGLTLLGFVRGEGYVVYAHPDRLAP